MVLSRADLESIHKFCTANRALLGASERAGRFYCKSIFGANEVMDWVDGRQVETGDTNDGVTALCPKCGIDAVLPSSAPLALDGQLLSEMHSHFFLQ